MLPTKRNKIQIRCIFHRIVLLSGPVGPIECSRLLRQLILLFTPTEWKFSTGHHKQELIWPCVLWKVTCHVYPARGKHAFCFDRHFDNWQHSDQTVTSTSKFIMLVRKYRGYNLYHIFSKAKQSNLVNHDNYRLIIIA